MGYDGLHHTDHPYGDDVPEIPPTETAEVIDFMQPQPAWRYTQPMHHARMHANAVLLPDGTVLVVGGGQHGRFEMPVRTSELFNPATETWTEVAAQRAPRIYHSTALLLPDGRVLSAGMDSGSLKTTAEIYSPPYLFRGPRPVIAQAPLQIGYRQAFDIATTAPDIERVVLMRPGSVTHSVNFEQRYVTLAFHAGADGLIAQAPPRGAIAPPGWYMLFVVNDRGVPSRAAWVLLA
jgi:galactose oxidase-like protein